MAECGKLVTYIGSNARFHLYVATAERLFGEASRFHGGLNVHVEVDEIGHELGMRLRLVPATHDAEGNSRIALFHKGRNDGVHRPFAALEKIGARGIEREQTTAVLQCESRSGGDRTGAEAYARIVALNQRHHIAFAIDDCKVNRVGTGQRRRGCHITVGARQVDQRGALSGKLLRE